MRFIKLTVSYDGTDFVGWQRQKNGITIQQKMEEAWLSISGESVTVTSSGRTDAGVHARGQVCSMRTETNFSCATIVRAFNARTPTAISVLKAEDAFEGFNAISHSVCKTYCYHIQSGRILDPLRERHAWFVPHNLDVDAMNKAAQYVVGEQDFACFQSTGSIRQSTVRNVMDCAVNGRTHGPFQYIDFSVTADGFLYNMVRSIVGTLIPVGMGRKQPEWILELIEQKDREMAGQTAPAKGLFLDHVVYADDASGGIHTKEPASTTVGLDGSMG